MISVRQAREIILKNIFPVKENELIKIESALGRVCVSDLKSKENIPPFDNSAMDGFAVRSEDLKGSTDDAIRVLELGTGLGLPGADLLLSDPYTALTSGVTSSGYYGKAYVGGVETHHLAFRTPKVDWQIWVKAGDEPLPMKYVITTKWMTGAPQYSVQLSNWNTKPVIASSRFKFVAPKGADKLEALPVDETGEITDKQESK